MSVYKRGKVWWIRFQSGGNTIRQPAKTRNKREAEEFEKRLRDQYNRIARGDRPRVTFADAVDKFTTEYFTNKGLRQGTQERYLTSLLALTDHFNGMFVDEITRPELVDYANKRGKKARKDLDCLSSMMTYMVDCEVIDFNPVIPVKGKITARPRRKTIFASPEGYKRLIRASLAELVPLVEFAKETGLRAEEQFSLTHPQINLKLHECYITDSKSGEPRTVPLSAKAEAQIRSQKRYAYSPYVFNNHEGKRYAWNVKGLPCFRRAFNGAVRRAKLPKGFTWHCLRHTFATWAIKGLHPWQNGDSMPIERLQKWLGHKDIQMTQRYAHLDVADLHAEAGTGTKVVTGARESKRGNKRVA